MTAEPMTVGASTIVRRRSLLAALSPVLVVALGACSALGAGPVALAPSASSAAVQPSAAESLEPAPDPAKRLESRLLEIMDAPDLAYRFEQSADITAGDNHLTQDSSGEVSGTELHMTLTVTQAAQQTVTEVAVVDGRAYQRTNDGVWTPSGMTTAVTSIAPQLTKVFGSADVHDAGQELHDGAVLHHLSVRGPIPLEGALTDWLPTSATNGTLDSLDLYLEPDGSPVDILYELSFQLQTDASSDPLQLHGVYRSSYADIGEPIVIDIPDLPKLSG